MNVNNIQFIINLLEIIITDDTPRLIEKRKIIHHDRFQYSKENRKSVREITAKYFFEA